MENIEEVNLLIRTHAIQPQNPITMNQFWEEYNQLLSVDSEEYLHSQPLSRTHTIRPHKAPTDQASIWAELARFWEENTEDAGVNPPQLLIRTHAIRPQPQDPITMNQFWEEYDQLLSVDGNSLPEEDREVLGE